MCVPNCPTFEYTTLEEELYWGIDCPWKIIILENVSVESEENVRICSWNKRICRSLYCSREYSIAHYQITTHNFRQSHTHIIIEKLNRISYSNEHIWYKYFMLIYFRIRCIIENIKLARLIPIGWLSQSYLRVAL